MKLMKFDQPRNLVPEDSGREGAKLDLSAVRLSGDYR
jgi:hypothetical protein